MQVWLLMWPIRGVEANPCCVQLRRARTTTVLSIPLNESILSQFGITANPVFRSKNLARYFSLVPVVTNYLSASSSNTTLLKKQSRAVFLRKAHFSATYAKYFLSSALPVNLSVHVPFLKVKIGVLIVRNCSIDDGPWGICFSTTRHHGRRRSRASWRCSLHQGES